MHCYVSIHMMKDDVTITEDKSTEDLPENIITRLDTEKQINLYWHSADQAIAAAKEILAVAEAFKAKMEFNQEAKIWTSEEAQKAGEAP